MPPKPDQPKSIKKVKQQATQEFFNKNRSKSTGGQSFTFNKAPINKDTAKREFLERREQTGNKRSAFTAKLYADDDELDDIKVLAGDQLASDIEEPEVPQKPREAKAKSKQVLGVQQTQVIASRISALHLSKGSVGLFAVCEVVPNKYAVVQHTRNVKGYLSLTQHPDVNLRVGQLIVALVTQVGLGVNEKGKESKKLQLSIDPSLIYKTLQVSKVTPGMMLQAFVASKEEKGYFLNLGFKDEAKGFLKYDSETKVEVGDLLQVVVVSATSKLVKCSADLSQVVQSTSDVIVNEHTMRPGFLVNAKVAKIFENGVKVTYLSGNQGTIFVDHTARAALSQFKVGQKVQARCISHDTSSKNTCLSLLPHILQMKSVELCALGTTFDKVKVQNILYGGSYHVGLPENQTGFLHKTHLHEKDEESKIQSLEVGHQLAKVRVKEQNYFDGIVQLTLRKKIIDSEALAYQALEIGQFVNATITAVNELRKTVELSLNDFVKGQLRLEHMADFAVQSIPQKFTQTGKQIKVRVFDIESRQVIFTKKDSLMKHDIPIYNSLKTITKGAEVHGVIVAQNEHGFIVKSFGEVKGLLSFADVKQNQPKKADYKIGSCVKTYVLFNKKGKGLALTLDSKKVPAVGSSERSLKDLLPTEEEYENLASTYKSQVKHSQESVGKTYTFKVVEVTENYYVVKTVLEKKSKMAIVPKVFTQVLGQSLIPENALDQEEFTIEGHVFSIENQIPLATVNPLIVQLKEWMPQDALWTGRVNLGVVYSVSESNGIEVMYGKGQTQRIAQKDLQSSKTDFYQVGQPIVTCLNKHERLSCRDAVIANCMTSEQATTSRSLLLNTFASVHSSQYEVGKKVIAEVQLVKDYGLIVQVDSQFTGLIVNEHKASQSKYKAGKKIDCVVLDVDNEKKIIDLSEKLVQTSQDSAARVQLIKDSYMIVKQKDQYGLCIVQRGLNDCHSSAALYSGYSIGDQVDVRVIPNKNTRKSSLQLMVLKASEREAKPQIDLREGAMVNGVLKSIKGHCFFVQVGNNGRLPLIGRLNRIEAQEGDFSQSNIGDRLQVKVLKITQDGDRQMIELTRRQEHMVLPGGQLNSDLLALLSLESLKEGQKIQALITDVQADASHPVAVQVSPFVTAQINFADLVTPQQLASQTFAKVISSQYKVGRKIEVVFTQGKFLTVAAVEKQGDSLKRGALCCARYVKVQPGYGVTVQVGRDTYGVIEMCELSDELQGCITKHMKAKNVFVARVIDTDKNGRLMLSARESVVENWQTIVGGSTAAFQKFDDKNQKQGNLRNKIIKFGAKLAVQMNSLFIGYVTNISKAGCFVQIGHNCTVRIGLNELSDSQDFDFTSQMPIGRLVTGRITKCIENGEDMRFNATLRKSLVMYGVGHINKNSLKAGQEYSALVLATSNQVVFAQLKGSYLKVEVSGCPKNTEVGQMLKVKLEKVKVDSITAKFVAVDHDTGMQDTTPQVVYESVQEEARQDIQAAQESKSQSQELDIEKAVAQKRQINATEQQIKDLETIAQIEEDDGSEEGDDESMEDDSDASEMARIQSKHYGDDSDESMNSAAEESETEEQGEAEMSEDAEMVSASDSGDSDDEAAGDKKPLVKGKKALREKIQQEKEIRAKETKMRQTEGANPQSINDFERLLMADQDQSYLWIQYMAFILDKLDLSAARKIAERGVQSISMTAENDKLNLWIAYMNLENQFGTEDSLQEVTKRALEVNDSKKVYLQLINMYRASGKLDFVEPIYKKLCKKYFESLEIWSSYIEFLFDVRAEGKTEFTDPKVVLQKSLQALPKANHINMISKYGIQEFKNGHIESGRTMFEGIVNNYPKRMDIWAIYMDMEVKHGGKDNAVQARHLFERCLSLPEIKRKPRSMKLVFMKYMEFEQQNGNKGKLTQLRQRVEEYLETAFKENKSESGSGSESNSD